MRVARIYTPAPAVHSPTSTAVEVKSRIRSAPDGRRRPEAALEPLDGADRAGGPDGFARDHGLPEDYAELWRWSVEDVERFWATIWDHYEVGERAGPVLADRSMPGARWFPEERVNFAGHMLRGRDPGAVADPPRLRVARARRVHVGRAGRDDRRDPRRPGAPRRRRGRPRRRLPAQRARDDPRLPGDRLAGRDLVLGRAGVRRPQRDRPLRADRAEGPARGRRLPLRRAGLRPHRRGRRDRCRDPGARAGGAARLPGRRRLGGGLPRTRGPGGARVRAGPPSITRSGSSTPRAPPGCRSRSSTATAASCSST